MMSKRAGKPKTSRSLATTLVIAFLALTLAALLIANLSVFLFLGRAILESVDSQQQLTAKEAANEVSSFVQEKFSELEATVKIGELTLASEQEQRAALGNLLGLVPAFRQLILFDSDDQELVQLSRVAQTVSGQLAERVESDLFLQTRQGNRYVSPVYVDDITSEPLVIMAVPALDTFGDYQGTLLAEVNLKFMWDLMYRLQVGETGQAYVVDREGNLLASGDISRALRGENVGQLDVVGDFMRNPVPAGEAATSMVEGIDGTFVVGTYVPLGLPDWAVVAELPIMEAFQPGIQSTVILGAVMLLVATLVGLVAVYIARRLAAPLLDLTSTAGRIAEGEMDLRAAPKGAAEIVDLAGAFNIMTAQLQELIGSLEQQVAERTRDLEHRSAYLQASAEVGRAASSILETDQLIHQVVELIRERFGLYFVGLFLLDESREWAVLQAGTGTAGQSMAARGHRIKVGEGMTGWSIAYAQPRVALEVGADVVRLAADELPDTRSEAALPLRSRGQIIGALNVQHTEAGAFDEDTIVVLQTMADQVAVALENARLFAESEEALEAERRAYGEISREAWTQILRSRLDLGYLCGVEGAVRPAPSSWKPEMVQASETGRTVREGGSTVAVPIRIRDQVEGVFRLRKPDETSEWTDEEIALVEALTEQVEAALESARLYQDTQRRAAQDRMMGEITSRIRQTLDVETVLQTAVREIGESLNLHDVTIRLEVDGERVGSPGGKENA